MSVLRRVWRVEVNGTPRHAVEDPGWGGGVPVARLVEGDVFGDWRPGPEIDLSRSRRLAPVTPGKVVGIGLNYRDHALERKKPLPAEPLVFLKPPSAVIGPGEAIVLPPGVGRVDHEAELGVVIGRRARRVTASEARAHVFGLTCVNDVTARALQDSGIQFSHAKGYDTFAPIGPCIVTGLDERAAGDAPGLTVEGLVNQAVRQRSTTAQLIFPVDDLIAYISAIMTLEPGDVLATGTPAGIGPLAAGDTVTVRVQGVGELTNPVVAG
jgi:2-keto-4-pentenoate hydratase/2-oxohepta-3-ene-1,7-dioic acid hydratase in catechol pathway